MPTTETKTTYEGHIVTTSSVIINTSDRGPITVPKESDQYRKVLGHLKRGKFQKALELADLALNLQAKSKGIFQVRGRKIYASDEAMPKSLAEKLVAMVKKGMDTKPFEKFWQNLKLNPSEQSRKYLYDFLDRHHVPFTQDGCFVAYKRVTSDFLDFHSHTFDNSPGKVVRMNRNDVDSSSAECSTGLHVASYGYAKDFYGNNSGVLLYAKVNPKDVVSVPPGYQGQKMRCCEYEVIGPETRQLKELVVEVEKLRMYGGTTELQKKREKEIPKEFKKTKSGVSIPGTVLREFIISTTYTVIPEKNKSRLVLGITESKRGTTYKADKSGRIRISRSLLKKAGIDHREVYTYEILKDMVIIEPK